MSYALGVAMPGEDAPVDPRAALDEAVALAARSDVAVVVVGYSFKLESEGFDRPSMDLPAGQDELIEAVAAANKNTVVVVVAGAPVTMTRWIERRPGRALRVVRRPGGGPRDRRSRSSASPTPSGKLPVSYPARIEDSTAYGHYPGENLHVDVRRRHLRRLPRLRQAQAGTALPVRLRPLLHDLRVQRPPGLHADGEEGRARLEVSLQVRNGGARAGAEVVQLYLRDVGGEPRSPGEGAEGIPPRDRCSRARRRP